MKNELLRPRPRLRLVAAHMQKVMLCHTWNCSTMAARNVEDVQSNMDAEDCNWYCYYYYNMAEEDNNYCSCNYYDLNSVDNDDVVVHDDDNLNNSEVDNNYSNNRKKEEEEEETDYYYWNNSYSNHSLVDSAGMRKRRQRWIRSRSSGYC